PTSVIRCVSGAVSIFRSSLGGLPPRCGSLITHHSSLLHLDELELHPVRPFEEAHAPAAGDDGLLEDLDSLLLQLFNERVEFVSVDGNVFHPVALLALLLVEKRRHVQMQPEEIQAVAVSRSRRQDFRAEGVDVELRGLLRILGLDVQVIQLQRHGHLLQVDAYYEPETGYLRKT